MVISHYATRLTRIVCRDDVASANGTVNTNVMRANCAMIILKARPPLKQGYDITSPLSNLKDYLKKHALEVLRKMDRDTAKLAASDSFWGKMADTQVQLRCFYYTVRSSCPVALMIRMRCPMLFPGACFSVVGVVLVFQCQITT